MSDDLTTITDPFSATALDEMTELRALSQALRLSQGFKLIFARCNQPQQRRNLIAALRVELPGLNIQEIHFDEPIMHLLDALRSRIAEPPPDAVFVSGLEYSLPVADDADAMPLVANLNASRNSFPQAVPCPLVLWIPEYILNAIMLGAPDFFSIRSGVYFFAAAPSETIELASTLTAGNEWAAEGLSLIEKQERIEAIKSLLADYESLPDGQRDYQTEVRLHWRLGNLFQGIGSFLLVQKHYEQVLRLARRLGDRVSESSALIGIGNMYFNQGNFNEAEEAYQQVLAASREIGNRMNEGVALSCLGNVAYIKGNLNEAEKFYQQGVEISRENGDRSNEGRLLYGIGNLYKKQNRLEEAEELYKQSLSISHELSDRVSEKGALNNLGNLYAQQSRFTEAEKLYRQSLAISQEVGDRVGEGLIFHNLGNIYMQQNNLIDAEELYDESLAIRRKSGDRIGQGDTLRNLALFWWEQENLTKALEFMQEAVEVLKTTEDRRRLAEAQELLSKLKQEAEEQLIVDAPPNKRPHHP